MSKRAQLGRDRSACWVHVIARKARLRLRYDPGMRASFPSIDISALFGADPGARAATDQAIMSAAEHSGFLLVRGLPFDVPIGAKVRSQLLRLFELPSQATQPLWRRKFDATHGNVYRGWFPLQSGFPTAKEGIDMGADIAYGSGVVDATDPLREATPLPSEEALPGWRAAAGAYYRSMENVSNVLMGSIARGLGLPDRYFDPYFERGLSTLRLIRYPVRDDLDSASMSDPSLWVTHDGERRHLTGKAHVDSGFLTAAGTGRRGGPAGLSLRQRLDRRAAGGRSSRSEFRTVTREMVRWPNQGDRASGDWGGTSALFNPIFL